MLTPLERALELLEDAARANGAADHRRSLELVAEVLGERGEEDGLAGQRASSPGRRRRRRPQRRRGSRRGCGLPWTRSCASSRRSGGWRRSGGTPPRRPMRTLTRWIRSLPAVGTHDVRPFRTASAARSRASRALRRGAAVLLGAAVASARDLDAHDRGLLPTGTTGVVVLDLSLSILDDQSGVVRRTLQSLVDSTSCRSRRLSDAPYELLPPGRRRRSCARSSAC